MFYLLASIKTGFSQNFTSCGNEFSDGNISIGNRTDLCDIEDMPTEDFGNFMYIPDNNEPIHNLRIYFHVMQRTSTNPDNFEETVQHEAYFDNLIWATNQEIFNNANYQEQCNGAITNAPNTPDSRIRLKLEDVFYHVDPIGHTNDEYLNGNDWELVRRFYNRNTYLVGNSIDDHALNIFLVESQSSTSGWGPGYNNEGENMAVVNKFYTSFQTNGPGGSITQSARTLAHEILHCLGLGHTWLSSQKSIFEYLCCPPISAWSPNHNHVMAYGGNMRYLSPLQVGHFRRHLLTTWRSKQIVEPSIVVNDYEFTNDYILPQGELINWIGNIIIKSGTQVTIEGELLMHQDKRIIIERGARLIVDGGLLTACNSQWKGIIVEGANYTGGGQLTNAETDPLNPNRAGTVVLKNGAIIENAITAISMAPTHIGNLVTHFGGLVDAEDSVIRNGDRAIAFMSHNAPDNSRISNCEITNVNWGITLWDCDDVLVEQTCFDDITNVGIFALDSDIIVQNGCQFTDMPVGIRDKDLGGAIRSSDIGNINMTPNFFDVRDTAIHIISSAVSNEDLSIINNNITSSIAVGNERIGIGVVGQSFFLARHNDIFRTRFAVKLENSGNGYTNLIDQNFMFENDVGVHTSFANGGALITNNCFSETMLADIRVFDGNINSFQRSISSSTVNDNSAGNSFSKNNAWEIFNQGASFKYYMLTSTQPNDPEGLANIVGPIDDLYTASQQINKDCGSNNNFIDCHNSIFLSGIETAVNDIESNNWIKSIELIKSNARVDYDAANYVHLLSGFEVDETSNFMAFIDGCNPGNTGAGGINFKEEDAIIFRSFDHLTGLCDEEVNSETEILQLIKDVESNIIDVMEDEELTLEEKSYLLSSLEICKTRLILKMGILIFENENYNLEEKIENYISFYDSYDEFQYQTLALGAMVRYNQFDRAENYLSSINTENEEQIDYLYTQTINIAFSRNPFIFELSVEEREKLNEIKSKEDPLSIYAYSIIDAIDSDLFHQE